MKISMTLKNRLGEWTTETRETSEAEFASVFSQMQEMVANPSYLNFTDWTGQKVLFPGKLVQETVITFNIVE